VASLVSDRATLVARPVLIHQRTTSPVHADYVGTTMIVALIRYGRGDDRDRMLPLHRDAPMLYSNSSSATARLVITIHDLLLASFPSDTVDVSSFLSDTVDVSACSLSVVS
jgi:hypothetical protein